MDPDFSASEEAFRDEVWTCIVDHLAGGIVGLLALTGLASAAALEVLSERFHIEAEVLRIPDQVFLAQLRLLDSAQELDLCGAAERAPSMRTNRSASTLTSAARSIANRPWCQARHSSLKVPICA